MEAKDIVLDALDPIHSICTGRSLASRSTKCIVNPALTPIRLPG